MTAQAGGASPLRFTTARETRRRLRALRGAIPRVDRAAADRAIRLELERLRVWQPGRRVAAFRIEQAVDVGRGPGITGLQALASLVRHRIG